MALTIFNYASGMAMIDEPEWLPWHPQDTSSTTNTHTRYLYGFVVVWPPDLLAVVDHVQGLVTYAVCVHSTSLGQPTHNHVGVSYGLNLLGGGGGEVNTGDNQQC